MTFVVVAVISQLQVGTQQCASSGNFSRIPARVALSCTGICQSPVMQVHFAGCPGASLADADVVLSGFQFQGPQRSTLEFRLGSAILSKIPTFDGGLDVSFRLDSRWTYSTTQFNEYFLWVDVEILAASNKPGARLSRGKLKCSAGGSSCTAGASIPLVDPGMIAMPMGLRLFRFLASRASNGVDISKLAISNTQTQFGDEVALETTCSSDSYVAGKTTDCATEYVGFLGSPSELQSLGNYSLGFPSLTGSGQVSLSTTVPAIAGIPRLLTCGLRGFAFETSVSSANRLWQLWSGVSAQACDLNITNSVFSAVAWTAFGNSAPPVPVPNYPVYYYPSYSSYAHTWELSPSVAY